MRKVISIADLHCDSLTRAYDNGWQLDDRRLDFTPRKLHPDRHWLQFMAIFIPDNLRGSAAREYFERVYAFYKTQTAEHRRHNLTTVLTVEGGAVLEGDPANVDALYAAGVRMLTLTWNAANELCGGVKSGGGFTGMGREAVRRMEACGMVADVSHISDEGFFELCGFAQEPFVASHSNARKICPHPRNLTDDMFREIVARKGLVGLNYCDDFILDGGGSVEAEDFIRHVHHFLALGGEDTLALGSDFDGADVPEYISDMAKTGFIIEEMRRSGIPEAVIEKICSQNAVRFFAGKEWLKL
jgi:membrane dipeptidase